MYVIHFDLKPLNNDGNLQVCMHCIHAQKGASDAPRKHFRAFKILAFLAGVPPEPPHTICIIGPTFCICSRVWIKICKCVGMYMVCACMHGWVHVCKQGVLVCVCVGGGGGREGRGGVHVCVCVCLCVSATLPRGAWPVRNEPWSLSVYLPWSKCQQTCVKVFTR